MNEKVKYIIKTIIFIISLVKEFLQKYRKQTDKETEKQIVPMPQGIQTNFPDEIIQTFGCYFLTLLKYVEIEDKKEFSTDKILEIYREAVELGIIDGINAFVRDAIAVVNLAAGFGTYDDMQRDLIERPTKLCIAALTRPQGGTHFILENTPDGTWDSLDPTRPAAASWTERTYRTITRA